jgi:serine/threonine protein kinase
MKELTGGHNGFVYLVKSLLDGNFYVRKQLTTTPNRTPSEVSVIQHIPAPCSIPRLISSHRCRRYDDDNRPVADIHVLYFQFCNGGNLAMLLENLVQNQQPVPEVFIWHFLARIAELVAGLHLGWIEGTMLPLNQRLQTRSVVYHADLHAGNIFLNWPSENDILPEIFLGDFGNASILSSDSATCVEDLLQDVACIGIQLIDLVDTYNIEAFNFDDENGEIMGSWEGRFPTSYSADLFTWCCRLSTEELPSAQQLVTDLLPVAQRHVERLLEPLRDDPQASGLFRWTQPLVPDHPLLLHETERITSKSTLNPLRELQNHWHFRPVPVPEALYNQVRSTEARSLQVARAVGYEEFLLADYATVEPHCRCSAVTTSDEAAQRTQ